MEQGKTNTNTDEWHLDKNISVTHIISTLLIAFSVLTWAMTIEKRIDKNEQAIQNSVDNAKRLESMITIITNNQREDYKEISQKLDDIKNQLIEVAKGE